VGDSGRSVLVMITTLRRTRSSLCTLCRSVRPGVKRYSPPSIAKVENARSFFSACALYCLGADGRHVLCEDRGRTVEAVYTSRRQSLVGLS
jgi:hypothetical protein